MTLQEFFSNESKWARNPCQIENGERECLISIQKNLDNKKSNEITAKLRFVIFGTTEFSPRTSIPAWNDAPERTFADIRWVIEEANV